MTELQTVNSEEQRYLAAYNVREIINAGFFQKAVGELDNNRLLCIPESSLAKEANVTKYEECLRISFAHALERVQRGKQNKISALEVYGPVCTVDVFKTLIKVPAKLAYIIRPLKNLEVTHEALHRKLLDKLFIIADLPIKESRLVLDKDRKPVMDERGMPVYDHSINTKAADVILRTWVEISNRQLGFPVKRELMAHINANAPTPGGRINIDISNQDQRKQLEELDAKIKSMMTDTRSTDEIIEADIDDTGPGDTQKA